jgi:YesN/AraC family two-component response regulator
VGAHEAVDYLPKPLKIDELITTLNRLAESPPEAPDPDP